MIIEFKGKQKNASYRQDFVFVFLPFFTFFSLSFFPPLNDKLLPSYFNHFPITGQFIIVKEIYSIKVTNREQQLSAVCKVHCKRVSKK